MATKESVPSSKSEKPCSPLQEHPSFYPYPDWASIQGYYGPGVPIPAHYFNATVAPGHVPHPYMWGPQPMIPPFAGPYTVYPHGGVYSHPSTTHMAFPVNQEIPSKFLSGKDREAKKSKLVDRHAVSFGNSNTESEECTENGQSQSGTLEEESSTDGIEGTTESRGSKIERSKSSDDIPNSERNATPTISLEMNAPCATITKKQLIHSSLPNLSPAVDLNASSIGKGKPCGTPLLPACSAREERELKREKRKQSNRESARRSRLRKQAETEELAVKVGTLNAENTALRSEITRLTGSSEKLRLENSALMEQLKSRQLNKARDIAPSTVIENLLSRIENPNHAGRSGQFEDELHEKPKGKIRQLLGPNSRTDSLVASS